MMGGKKITKLQKKFLIDLSACKHYPDDSDWLNYNKQEVYTHLIKLGWKDKSFKSVLGSLYTKEILYPECDQFFVHKKILNEINFNN